VLRWRAPAPRAAPIRRMPGLDGQPAALLSIGP
jgi:hypothetical protein